ncbi:hypothetical protein D9613_000592 [Agrocybe pediades]|uniref:Letm1 RBD domain-containing protein n=1 Tax=Agrocybe pediades TaxID=84607 RepID=A0A8H4VSZ4_9AGAR|nr:hypothetical protein D9613_000592 [Agrocybe pediades]
MLRTLGRDATRRHSSLILLRSYTTPSTTPSKLPSSHIPLANTKKPKVNLHPAPIKPKPSHTPTTTTTTTSSTKIPRSFSTEKTVPQPPSKVAEEIKHDVHDAEVHGILTPPPADANWAKRTLHQAIQLFKFYYRGVKLIFSRRKQITIINARIKAGGTPLTRSEFRLIETQKDDINKVVPFLIIALILEEVIPLIAIYAPFMLPSTCILPAQRERIEAKRADKAQLFASQYHSIYTALRRAEQPPGFLPLSALSIASAPTAVCGLLGLSTIGIDFLRIRRIRHRLEFITRDDQLLLQDNKQLSQRELIEALEERGIATANLAQKDLHARLSWWLDAIKDSSSEIDDNALARRLALAISLRA